MPNNDFMESMRIWARGSVLLIGPAFLASSRERVYVGGFGMPHRAEL